MIKAPSIIRRHVTAKFLVMFIPIFLLFILAAFYMLAERHISISENKLASRIGNQVGKISNLIDGELIVQQQNLVSKLTSTLLADPAITCVDILSNGKYLAAISQPRNLGCAIMKPEKTVSIPAAHTQGLVLNVGFSTAEIKALKTDTTWLAIYTAIFASISAIVFGALGLRYSVSKPVKDLIEIINIADKNPQIKASISSPDEIGQLCTAFNSLQDRIACEQSRSNEILQELSTVYNSTPALLFTMDSNGLVKSASDFWLKETGYLLKEVVNHPLAAILCPHSRSRLKSSILIDLQNCNFVRDIPLSLWYKDGSEIDVLLSIELDRRKKCNDKSYVCVMNDVSLLRRAEQNLHSQAITDQLTNLPNRRGLSEHFDDLQNNKHSSIDSCAILFIDLDNFKTVNDTFGHHAGDQILCTSASRICAVVGNSGMVSRIGGDEFAIILAGQSNVASAETIAERIIKEICKPIMYSDTACYVGASIGIAHSTDFPLDISETLRLSDQAMYVAKSSGKNRYYVYEENRTAEIQSRAEQIQLIQNGICKNWFDIYLQPIMNLNTMQPYAFEALLRVTKKDVIPKSIEGLIRVAEETGQMEKLGIWIFEKSMSKFNSLTKHYPDNNIALTINLSPQQLTENFIRVVKKHMLKYPNMHKKLIFEITETAAIDRFDAVCVLLQDLRSSGIRIALDDFGTGYSSLSYISRLPIDILKLDKNFILNSKPQGNQSNQKDPHKILVRTLAALANDLGLEIIAEGLETIENKEFYRNTGIRLGQGFLFSKPMSVSDAIKWLDACSQSNEIEENYADIKISA